MRRVNGWLTVFWVVMIPISVLTHWVSSVTYVAALSLWALVSGHWSAWQAARVEVEQAREAKKREEEDIPGEIVERVVAETELRPAMGGLNPSTGGKQGGEGSGRSMRVRNSG